MSTISNRLSGETSPYLLQHASNPVNWFPWGDEAFAKAKKEDKLILVSIGYSSCHWCHVMEREAFSDAEVAKFLNDNYVCIKVDREERPDVDQIYMNAVQIITRSGGWPLNCFTLPDGRPVFGGTYFRTEHWMDIIRSLHSTWVTNKQRVMNVADDLTQGLSTVLITGVDGKSGMLSPEVIKQYVENWSKYFDARHGANKGAPKFPMPGSLMFLLDYAWLFNDDSVKGHVRNTLDKMMNGGIYDHLGGGFFRYSVDEHWHVPHFEKMLYDNALMISLYSMAYKHFKDDNYRRIVYEVADFMKREMLSPNGGYYSAIDADSEGEEGRFYTFSKREVENFLGDNAEAFSIAFGVSATGNHLGQNVLRLAASEKETACLLGIEPVEVSERLKSAKKKMFDERARRIRPATDDKQLASWNALSVTAFSSAYIVFNDDRFLTDAISAIKFIEDKLMDDGGELYRVHCKGETKISAFLDDYAFLVEAYLALFRATHDEEYLLKAKKWMDFTINGFFDEKNGMFFYTSDSHNHLIIKKMEMTDGVVPSSNAVMADNLLFLSGYFREPKYADMAREMVLKISEQQVKGGPYLYRWAGVHLKCTIGPAELQAVGEKGKEMLREVVEKTSHPFLITYVSNNRSAVPICTTMASREDGLKLCHANSCLKPTQKVDEVLNSLNSFTLKG